MIFEKMVGAAADSLSKRFAEPKFSNAWFIALKIILNSVVSNSAQVNESMVLASAQSFVGASNTCAM